MHEMSIAENILQIVEEQVGQMDHPADVTRINLKVGKLRSVVPESLEFCFSIMAKGTALETAQLHIDEVPVRIVCQACQAAFDLAVPLFACTECGSSDVCVVSGEELSIDSIEIEVPEGRNASC
jgi:hydrogenase nickel incorporation protein HypA/HybF